MKRLLLLLLPNLALHAQQSTLLGTVTLFNSQFDTGTRQYVPNAQIEETFGKSQATTTDADGSFRLPLVGIKDQEKVRYSVQKDGYEVVNIDALQAVAGQMEPSKVFMAPEGKIAENKLKYYRINRNAAEKALSEKLGSLEKEILAAQPDPTRLQQLQAEYAQLQAQLDRVDDSARELAERYARTNLDDVSTDYQRAFRCFQRGQLDSALLIFNALGLESNASLIISEQNRNADLAAEYARRDSDKNKRKVAAMQTLRFKAQLHGTQLEFARAEDCYRLMLRLDSSDVPALKDYANFLSAQSRYDSAVLFCQKWINRAKTKEEQATAYNNLGNIYRSNQNKASAESAYKASLKIFRALNETNKGAFLPSIALVLNNLGNYYRDAGQLYSAKDVLTESLDIYRQLVVSDEKQYLPYLALALNNMGRYYFDRKQMLPARNAFNESLDLYQKLADDNPNAVIPENIQTFYNLTVTFADNDKAAYSLLNHEYEALLKKALKTHEQLAATKPDIFLPFVALTLNNLGNYYTKQHEMAEAAESFQKALNILNDLAARNPNAFLPFLASVYTSLGKYYLEDRKNPESESAYLKALDIYQSLSRVSPKAFLPKTAALLARLGELKKKDRAYTSALQYYSKELDARKTIGIARENLYSKEWNALVSHLVTVKYASQDGDVKARADTLRADLDSSAYNMYAAEARKALFNKDFVFAEGAAEFGLRFGRQATALKAVLVMALLCRDRWKDAKARCKEFMEADTAFAQACQKGLLDMEAAGITHADFSKIRKLLEQK